ncbi:MAG: RNA-guided endonuclease TnpB family protein, partial [Xenococcaceae cyanobacterium]
KGFLINADLNGAANILKKVEIQLGLNLAKVCRRVLTLATRFRIWETKKERGAVWFQPTAPLPL